MKEKLYVEINIIINEVLCTKKNYDLDTHILGEECIMDSIVLLAFVARINEKYGINILKDDYNLDCLESLEKLINHVEIMIQ